MISANWGKADLNSDGQKGPVLKKADMSMSIFLSFSNGPQPLSQTVSLAKSRCLITYGVCPLSAHVFYRPGFGCLLIS
jgi:hypothetical protein